MKKFLILLCAFLLPLTLFGCKGPYSDSEAADILRELLERDVELNRYIWGDGFSTLEDPGEAADDTSVVYKRVNEDAPYHSVESLRKAVNDLYAEEVALIINAYAFENTEKTMARFSDFYQNDEVADLQIDVTLNHPPYELNTVIYPSTMKVTRSSATIINAEVEYSNGPDGERRTMEVSLLKENDTWKLNSQTWAGSVG